MLMRSIRYQVSCIRMEFSFPAGVFFLLVLIASCTNEVKIPADVLPQNKMAMVLADVQQVEALIQSSALERNDSTRAIAYGYYKSVFEKNKITPAQFRKSFTFYANHLDLMDKMYDDVLINLSKRQAEEGNK
jgi:hypothetical protein